MNPYTIPKSKNFGIFFQTKLSRSMKYLFIICLLLFPLLTFSQSEKEEKEAIKATIQLYFDGMIQRDAIFRGSTSRGVGCSMWRIGEGSRLICCCDLIRYLCCVVVLPPFLLNILCQAVFCERLKSIIDFPPTSENLHRALILSPSLLPTIRVRV